MDIFRVCRTPETSLYTHHAHQHQKIHLQHKIKIVKFSACCSCDFGIDFHRKINDFCCQNLPFVNTLVRKGVFYYKNHRFSDGNLSQNHMRNMLKKYNFYFMLQTYFLMLVSVVSVCGRFWGPTDSKNVQTIHSISNIPLQ